MKVRTATSLKGVVLLVVFVVFCVAWLTRVQEGPLDKAGLPHSTAEEAVPPKLELAASPSTREPETTIVSVTPAEAFLADYWGEQWPAVKAGLDARGVNYAERPAITVPWEVAASQIEKRLPLTSEERVLYKNSFMGWKGVADRDWLVSQFGAAPPLDPDASVELTQLAEAHAREMEPVVDELLNALEREVIDAWHSGRFVRAPYSPIGAPGFGKQGFYSKGDGYAGWTASFSLSWEDVPHLEAIRDDIAKLVEARDQEVRAFLGDWRMKNSDSSASPK